MSARELAGVGAPETVVRRVRVHLPAGRAGDAVAIGRAVASAVAAAAHAGGGLGATTARLADQGPPAVLAVGAARQMKARP